MFFRPSRVFPLQWPLSGTMRLTVTCSITPAFARSAAAAALSPPWQVCCIPARAHRHVFACKPIRIILWIFTEIPDPDVEFTCGYKRCFENAKRGANCSNVCMRHDDSVDAVCKRGLEFFLYKSEPLRNKVAFMLRQREPACSDKFPEWRSNEVSSLHC